MDGILFLHDQAGLALQEAVATVQRLTARVAELEQAAAAADAEPPVKGKAAA